MLVWKKGNFGVSKPFWVTEKDDSVKNHLFIYEMKEKQLKPVWQSSNLDMPNYYVEVKDIDGDGKNEMIVVEGSYSDPEKRQVTFWRWNGWGFSCIQ
jgi:poly-gamma-glutamate synthesis protein (capsule biosynthesis protein)